ncbi:MAG TPA: anti-sigma regulatory factor [Candidatus Sulfomarinibacteraceae bacterium]|nr:anti-sigma regulatory factor [Candidatus Sulfomarinibacteraceae bacterium]
MDSEKRVAIQGTSDIVSARQQGRQLAIDLGFSTSDQALIATAISEVARNIVLYARWGAITFSIVEKNGRRGMRIVATDDGPGIKDVELAMQDGYSTSQGLGLGLPGARRLMDDFELESEVGRGTTIVMSKWLKPDIVRP